MIVVLKVESKYKNQKGLLINNNKNLNVNVASQPKFMQGNKNNMFRLTNK